MDIRLERLAQVLVNYSNRVRRGEVVEISGSPIAAPLIEAIYPTHGMAQDADMAIGAPYPGTGGKNKSSLHWDLICDLHRSSEVYVDDRLAVKNGKWAS